MSLVFRARPPRRRPQFTKYLASFVSAKGRVINFYIGDFRFSSDADSLFEIFKEKNVEHCMIWRSDNKSFTHKSMIDIGEAMKVRLAAASILSRGKHQRIAFKSCRVSDNRCLVFQWCSPDQEVEWVGDRFVPVAQTEIDVPDVGRVLNATLRRLAEWKAYNEIRAQFQEDYDSINQEVHEAWMRYKSGKRV